MLRCDARQPLCVQPSQHAHRDQRDKKSSTNAPRSGATNTGPIDISGPDIAHTRLAIFTLPRLANIATKLPDHVARRPVLADQKPTIAVAIGRSAAYGRRVLPDQLREVADLVRELALLVVVVAFFVRPAVDGEGWSRVALG